MTKSSARFGLGFASTYRRPEEPFTYLERPEGVARRFNATLVGSDDVPFAALAKREGVSPSYCTRLVRLSYLAPDIT